MQVKNSMCCNVMLASNSSGSTLCVTSSEIVSFAFFPQVHHLAFLLPGFHFEPPYPMLCTLPW